MALKDEAIHWSKDRIREELHDRRDSLATYTHDRAEAADAFYSLDKPPQTARFKYAYDENIAAIQAEIDFLKSLL